VQGNAQPGTVVAAGDVIVVDSGDGAVPFGGSVVAIGDVTLPGGETVVASGDETFPGGVTVVASGELTLFGGATVVDSGEFGLAPPPVVVASGEVGLPPPVGTDPPSGAAGACGRRYSQSPPGVCTSFGPPVFGKSFIVAFGLSNHASYSGQAPRSICCA
jgi:hypothetical protein